MTAERTDETATPDEVQGSRYDFPYHHLVGGSGDRGFHLHRYYHFGLDYWLNLDAVIEELRSISPESLLDVGCGDGRLLKELGSGCAPSELVGIDLSERALDFARGFNPDVDFHSSWENVVGPFDCVTAVEVLEHVRPDELPSTIETIRSVTSDDGFFLLTVPSDQHDPPSKHHQHFSRRKLIDLLQPYFTPEEVRYTVTPNLAYNILRRLLVNRFWISNWTWLNDQIWCLAKRWCQEAEANSGKHIFAVFRPG